MKKYKSKDLSDTIGTVGSMLLFLLFAGCMLMIVAAAAGTYSRISTNFDKTFGTTASLRYVSNKIKGSESARIIENGSGLVLKSGAAVNVIYFKDGGLYEKTVASEEDASADGGDKIFDLSEMNISEDGGAYRITAAFGGDRSHTFVRRR